MNSLIRSSVGSLLSASKQNVRLLSKTTTKPDFSKLVKNNKVVIFMKGVPEEPKCGFSNIVVQILKMHGVHQYDAHNVLESDDIRNGIYYLFTCYQLILLVLMMLFTIVIV